MYTTINQERNEMDVDCYTILRHSLCEGNVVTLLVPKLRLSANLNIFKWACLSERDAVPSS